MAILEKLAKVAKGIFASSDGTSSTKPYGQAQLPNAGPDYDLTGYLSAMPPLPAMGPADYEVRKRDFRIAENLDFIPGNGKYQILEGLADKWNVLRTIIDTKKDLVASTTWSIKVEPKEGESEEDVKARQSADPVVQQLTAFFMSPDGERTFFDWIREWLEDIYVIDAGCVEVVRDNKGKICSLVVVAGNTINRVIDDRGWTPKAAQVDPRDGVEKMPVAYQQVLGGSGAGSEGVPQRNLTMADLLYTMRNARPGHKYGQSSVEKIYNYAMTGIMADQFVKDYYMAGNQPPGIMVLSGMPPEKVEEYEKKWNAVYAGNLATRRRIAMISAGPGDQKNVQYIPTKEPLLKSDIYMDYIRFACAEFSIPSAPFEKAMNRASAKQAADTASEQGLIPDLVWIASQINRLIKDPLYFNLSNYTFAWGDRRPVNALDAAQVDKIYVSGAMETINEARKKVGLPPSDEPNADKLGAMSPQNGWIPLNSDDFADLQGQIADAKPKPQPAIAPPPPAPGSVKPKQAAKKVKSKKKSKAASGDGEVLIARHGSTKNDDPDNPDNEIVSGRNEVPLDAEGIAEAGRLAESLADKGITHILSSPTKRALQTATIVGQRIGAQIIVDSDLAAPDYPEFEGETVGDTKALWKKAQDNPDEPMGGGETYGNFLTRNLRAKKRAQAFADQGSKVLMLTHSRNIEAVTGEEEPTGGVSEIS